MKLLKLAAVSLVVATMTGCVNNMDIARAKLICKDQRGMYTIASTFGLKFEITCNNGHKVTKSYTELSLIVGDEIADYVLKGNVARLEKLDNIRAVDNAREIAKNTITIIEE